MTSTNTKVFLDFVEQVVALLVQFISIVFHIHSISDCVRFQYCTLRFSISYLCFQEKAISLIPALVLWCNWEKLGKNKMNATFCFTTEGLKNDESYTATFQSSADEEEYAVKYHLLRSSQYDPVSGCNYSRKITLDWKKKSSKFIKLSLFRDNSYISDRNSFVKDNISTTFCLSSSPQFNGVFIIVAPSVDFKQVPLVSNPNVVQKLTFAKPVPICKKKLENLSTDMGNLLQTGNLSDVVLTDGSKEILAHKLILSARSSVFAKMFLHPVKEKQENRITITDISIEILRELLHFMYSGTVVIKDSEMARNLYIAADKYDVEDLKNICAEMLKSVDVINVIDTLLLADLYSDNILKKAALKFISQNYSQVKALRNWNTFMKGNQSLAIEILSFLVDQKM